LPEGFSGCSIKGVKKQKQHKLMTSFSKVKVQVKKNRNFPFFNKEKRRKKTE